MESIKFHKKPTQIDRQNPVKIFEMLDVIVWLYYLPKNGYYVLFKVGNGASTAELAGFDRNDELSTLQNSKTEIITRKDLVDYVKTWGDLTVFDIVKIQEDMLKMDLEKSQIIHTL